MGLHLSGGDDPWFHDGKLPGQVAELEGRKLGRPEGFDVEVGIVEDVEERLQLAATDHGRSTVEGEELRDLKRSKREEW